MTGVCGTSKQRVKHHYYICSAKKKKLCTKRAVRQDWIEHLVLKHLRNLVRSKELLEFIAESTSTMSPRTRCSSTMTNIFIFKPPSGTV